MDIVFTGKSACRRAWNKDKIVGQRYHYGSRTFGPSESACNYRSAYVTSRYSIWPSTANSEDVIW